jgi:hypothetical protein
MRLQLAEHSRPLSRPIAQDAGHRQLRVVVEDRLRYAAEEMERGVVPVTKRLGGLLRIGLRSDLEQVVSRTVEGGRLRLACEASQVIQNKSESRCRFAVVLGYIF